MQVRLCEKLLPTSYMHFFFSCHLKKSPIKLTWKCRQTERLRLISKLTESQKEETQNSRGLPLRNRLWFCSHQSVQAPVAQCRNFLSSAAISHMLVIPRDPSSPSTGPVTYFGDSKSSSSESILGLNGNTCRIFLFHAYLCSKLKPQW